MYYLWIHQASSEEGQKMKFRRGVPGVAQWLTIQRGTMSLQVWSLALLSGLRIQRYRELWCRLQTRLGSHVAVAVV